MRTGRRCTTLMKLPVAFCAGSSAKVEPVPIVKPVIRPSKTRRRPYMSTSRSTRWPMRRSASCVSLKLASIQISVSERMAISDLAGLDVVAGVDVAARDHAVDLGVHVAIAQIQFGLVQIGLGQLKLGLGLLEWPGHP